MITIQSGKMIIPEEERFVGFAGDDRISTRQFILPRTRITDIDAVFSLYLRYDDDRVTSAPLSVSIVDSDTILTWNIRAEHLLKSGIVMAQIKYTNGEGCVTHYGWDYFVVGDISERSDDGEEYDILSRTEFEERMAQAVRDARATAPYIGDDGYWYIYSREQGDYVRSFSASGIPVDSEISGTSTNPIENRAVKQYVDACDSTKVDKTTCVAGVALNSGVTAVDLVEGLADTINPPSVTIGVTRGYPAQYGKTGEGTPVFCTGLNSWKTLAKTEDIPTKISELINDSGFLNAADIKNHLHYVPVTSEEASSIYHKQLANLTPNSYSYVLPEWWTKEEEGTIRTDAPPNATKAAWILTIMPSASLSFGMQIWLEASSDIIYKRIKVKQHTDDGDEFVWSEWASFADPSLSVSGAFADAKAVGEALALKTSARDVDQKLTKALTYAEVTYDPNVAAADRRLSDLENNTYSWVNSDYFSDAPVSNSSSAWIFTMKNPSSSSYGMQLWISPKYLQCYSRRCAIQSGKVVWNPWYAMTDSTLTKMGVAADAKAVGDALALKANTQDVGDALALKANTQDVGDALALKANTQDVGDALALKANTQDVDQKLTQALKYTVVTIDPNVSAADRKLIDLENNTYSWVNPEDFSDAPVGVSNNAWIFTMKSPSSSYGMQLWISPKHLQCYSRRCAIQSGEIVWNPWYAMTDSTLTKVGVAADAKAVGDALADIAVNYKPGAVYYSFGDSTTKGRVGTWDGSISNSTKVYPNAVAAMLHMTLNNQAVAGQGLIGDWGRTKANKGIIEMIADLDMSDASLITVGWAYNDNYAYGVYNNPADMGSYTDVTTVDVTDTEAVKALISYNSNGNPKSYGTTVIGYYYTIMKLLQTKCPNAQIVLVTGYGHPGGDSAQQINATLTDQFSHTFTFKDGAHTVKELYDELEKMAHLHGWCCVNQAKGCTFNEFNASVMFGDFIHPNENGYAAYSNNLAPRIASYYANRSLR